MNYVPGARIDGNSHSYVTIVTDVPMNHVGGGKSDSKTPKFRFADVHNFCTIYGIYGGVGTADLIEASLALQESSQKKFGDGGRPKSFEK